MWILSPTEIASSFCCIVSPRVVSFSIPPLPFTSSPTSSRKPSATESPINASRNNFDEKELPVDDADELGAGDGVVVVRLGAPLHLAAARAVAAADAEEVEMSDPQAPEDAAVR